MLRPLGDIIAGVGNASLGAVTFGQSGTLGRGLGQIGNGIIGETEILLTDVVAFATGTVRYGSQVVTRSVDVLTLGNIHSDGNPLVAIGELVSRAIIPGYGNHGGRGLGREGLPIFNHRDRGSRYHDAKFGQEPYANTRWVVHGFEPSPREGDVADGPLAIAYTLAGTVPFLFYDLVFPQPSKKP